MKRLLIFLPYVPYPLMRGTYQRVYHLAEALGGILKLTCSACRRSRRTPRIWNVSKNSASGCISSRSSTGRGRRFSPTGSGIRCR